MKRIRGAFVAAVGIACFAGIVIVGPQILDHLLPDIGIAWPEVNIDLPLPARHRDFPVREWLHRVDSLERVRFAKERYSAIEIDIVFEEQLKYFDVGHPPVPSVGLNLENVFSELEALRQFYFWLDFKNLTEGNKHDSLAVLNQLSSKFGIKDRVIVESTNPEPLSIFTDAGYYTSFYVVAGRSIRKMSETELNGFAVSVLTQAARSRICAVSADHRLYGFLAHYFPKYDRLHWWATPHSLAYKVRANKILTDPGVKVMLFHAYSEGYR